MTRSRQLKSKDSYGCAEKVEKKISCSLEERRERLQPVMDNVSKGTKEYGTVKAILPVGH